LEKLATDQSDDDLVALAIVRHTMNAEHYPPSLADLLWASEMIDHLDTLGLELGAKPRRQSVSGVKVYGSLASVD
jgi:hypothetical protein